MTDVVCPLGIIRNSHTTVCGGGRVERRCWVNFQCRGVLLVWMTVGQGPIALAVGAGGGLFGHFFLSSDFFSFLSPSLWETARYRLKYCLKGPLNPKQPTNHGLSACTGDNPRDLASGLSPIQADKPWYNYFIPPSSV